MIERIKFSLRFYRDGPYKIISVEKDKITLLKVR